VTLGLSVLLPSCYMFEFFQRSKPTVQGSDGSVVSGGVLGESLGGKAGEANEAALQALYGVTTTYAPAAIRPDPDLFVRRLVRQFRTEGATVARQIGEVEQFRLLLGGASQDFSKTPQETYDATSLLAISKVAFETCRGLVAPNPWEHTGWSSVLPNPASDTDGNIRWLIQRLTGVPAKNIAASDVSALTEIMNAEKAAVTDEWWASDKDRAPYIPVCAAILLNTEALYL